MKDSKLIQQLKILNEVELKRFYLFLRSPYFTKSKDVVKLFEFVRKFHPNFKDKLLEKARIFKKLFPKEPYSDIKLRNLQAKLSKIVESYLIQISYEQDEFEKKKRLTQIYDARNYYAEFERNSIQLLNSLDHQTYQDTAAYYDRYQIAQAYYLNINTSKKTSNVSLLKSALQNLQNFYAIEELRLGIDLKNRERIFSEAHGFQPNPNVQISEDNLLYSLLDKSWKLLENNDDVSFFDFKNTFLKNIPQIPLKEGMNIFPVLINYAIQQLGKREEKFGEQIFDLYKIGLANRLLFANGELSEETFFNIVTISSSLKEFSYAHQFIQHYEQFLNPIIRIDTRTLSLGILLFKEDNFVGTIDALLHFKFSHILNTLIAKSLLSRTYYHLYDEDPSYFEVLCAHCDTFSRFLGRTNSISEQKKIGYKNFLSLLRRVIHHKNAMVKDNSIRNRLINELDSFVTVVAKGWFRKIINEL